MDQRPVREVEDYTGTVLVMGFVNLFNLFFMLWAFVGMAAVIPCAFAAHLGIGWLARRRDRRTGRADG